MSTADPAVSAHYYQRIDGRECRTAILRGALFDLRRQPATVDGAAWIDAYLSRWDVQRRDYEPRAAATDARWQQTINQRETR